MRNIFKVCLFSLFTLIQLTSAATWAEIPLDVKNNPPCIPAWNQFSGGSDISSTIHSSLKGNDDLIYLGGRDGLYRIEGGDVHTWLPDFTDNQALPSGQVKAMVKDEHFIWIGSNTGISRLNTKTGKIERNEFINQSMGFAPVNTLAIFNEYLFVGTKIGGYIAKRSDSLANISVVTKFEDTGSINALLVDDGRVLAATSTGLWRLPVDQKAEQLALNDTILLDIEKSQGRLWSISQSTLYRQGDNFTWQGFTHDTLSGLPEARLTNIANDSMERLWIGGEKGLSRWDPSQPHPSSCRRSILGSTRDEDISIAHLSSALGQYMFFGTRGRGAAFAPINSFSRRIVPGGHYDSGLPSNSIWSHFIDSQGRFYAGTSKGLYLETEPQSGYFRPVAEKTLGKQKIYTVKQFDEELWVGTSQGLFVERNGEIIHLSLLEDKEGKLLDPAIFAIKQKQEKVFAATSLGLLVIDMRSLGVAALYKTKADIHPVSAASELHLPVSRVWSIDFAGNRTFIAGNDGAFEVDTVNHTIISSTVDQDEKKSKPIGYIYNIAVADDNLLLLGTEAGLVQTDFEFSYYKKITEINGRHLYAVMSSGHDSAGNTWIGVANTGLFQYQLETGRWTHLTQSNGLITNGVSQLGLSFTDDGMMSVSNGTGASIIDLRALEAARQNALDIRLFDRARNHVFEKNEAYRLHPNERDLTLSFIATDLIEAGLHSVDYQLTTNNGVQHKSSIALDEPLSFVSLSPGTYQFNAVVKATSGIFSGPIGFSIEVEPYWWETSLFKLIILLTIFSLIAAYFYYRTHLIEQRLDIITEERKRIAQDLHDTSLQDIFGAKMLGRTLLSDLPASEDKERATRFISLIDNAIKSLRTSVDSLSNLTKVPSLSVAVKELETTICLPPDTRLHIQDLGKSWRIKHQRRFFIYRIIREATNNAAKHAQAKTIIVTMHWSRFHLFIDVIDDGIGFDTGSSVSTDTYGLGSMYCMAKSAKINLVVNANENKGTKITVKVPRFYL